MSTEVLTSSHLSSTSSDEFFGGGNTKLNSFSVFSLIISGDSLYFSCTTSATEGVLGGSTKICILQKAIIRQNKYQSFPLGRSKKYYIEHLAATDFRSLPFHFVHREWKLRSCLAVSAFWSRGTRRILNCGKWQCSRLNRLKALIH